MPVKKENLKQVRNILAKLLLLHPQTCHILTKHIFFTIHVNKKKNTKKCASEKEKEP